ARNVDQERNERRLIDISPGQVIATGHVIKFIAKITVAVVEIQMKQKFSQRDGANDGHAGCHGRLLYQTRRGSIYTSSAHRRVLPFKFRSHYITRVSTSSITA